MFICNNYKLIILKKSSFVNHFFLKNENNFTKTIKIINETIIDGPEGIFKVYEKYNPNKIPRNEKNTDKSIIILYFFATMEAAA